MSKGKILVPILSPMSSIVEWDLDKAATAAPFRVIEKCAEWESKKLSKTANHLSSLAYRTERRFRIAADYWFRKSGHARPPLLDPRLHGSTLHQRFYKLALHKTHLFAPMSTQQSEFVVEEYLKSGIRKSKLEIFGRIGT